MKKLMKPKTVYLLVYECGNPENIIFNSQNAALRIAEAHNQISDNHIRVVKYNPEI